MRFSPVAFDREPLALLPALAAHAGAALVHVPDPTDPVTLVGVEPVAELRVDGDGTISGTAVRAGETDPIAAVARFVRDTPAVADTPFPLRGGAIGFLAYELGHWTVPRIAARPTATPLAVLRRYDPLLVYQHRTAQWWVAGNGTPPLDRWRAASAALDDGRPLARSPLVPAWTEAEYTAAIRRTHAHLLAGDIYQANLTLPFTTALDVPAWRLCRRLAAAHPAPYVAYLDLGDAQLVANSPELFLRVRGDRIETRPIKGTRPRGPDPDADRTLVRDLTSDDKERAEHVMIVDLERNDLGRVCTAGSVQVDALLAVESHPTVHHLVSTIGGRLRPGVGLAELLAATFPGGSITGAPKQRAMQILADLEPWPRGPYCGAVGVFDPRGDLELGLAIRTAVVAGGRVRWHAGGGIVVDSTPEREWAEAWLKTAALRHALAGS